MNVNRDGLEYPFFHLIIVLLVVSSLFAISLLLRVEAFNIAMVSKRKSGFSKYFLFSFFHWRIDLINLISPNLEKFLYPGTTHAGHLS